MEYAVHTVTLMQAKYSVAIHLVGTVHINRATGALSWDRENLDPVIKSYIKKYLFDEGFIEHALGMLDPAIDQEITALLDSLSDFGS
jgi:hypothetical protein